MQTINLDLSAKRIIPLLHAKQNDVGKKVAVVLTDNGAAYSIPGDAVFSVWYSGASGEGNYTTIDGRSAFSVSGNTVTVELITQMLQNKGPGQLCLVMNKADGTQLGLWNIPYFVEEVPGAGSAEATGYYTAFLEAVQAMGIAGIESTEHPGCYYRVVNGETEWLNPPMVVDEEYRTSERYMGKPVYRKLMCFGELPNSGVRVVSTKIPSTASIVGLERMSTEPDTNAYGQHIPNITHEYFLEHDGQYRLEVFTDADAAQITYLYYTIKYTKD